jgi:exosortase/archaeosortase family protein
MLAGAGVVYITNLLRVIALFFILKYHPDLFSFAHMYMGQALIIFVCVVFFLIWVGRPVKRYEPNC